MTGLTDGMTAVVFDFYGTLTPVSPSEAWASNAARLAAVMGVPVDALVRVLDDSFPERISGALGDVRQTMRGDRRPAGRAPHRLSSSTRRAGRGGRYRNRCSRSVPRRSA